MKKLLSIALTLALALTVFAGCQTSQPEAPQGELSSASLTADPILSRLDQDAALSLALADAQVTKEEILELEIELDKEGASAHYDVDFEKGGEDYKYEIDAETGKILKKEIPQAPQQPADTTKITRDDALKIALEDAKVTQDQIHDLEVELDNDGGALHFDVDFEVNDKDYDYEIDAETGKILKKQIPKQETAATSSSSGSSSSSASTSKYISRTEARDIALKHAGLSTSQVRDLEVELDKDDGKVHYDVDFEADGYDYDYEIDAESGKILKSRKEKD